MSAPTDTIHWDSTLPGFGRRVRSNGRATWIVQWRHAGSTRRRTLGTVDELTEDAARHQATVHLHSRQQIQPAVLPPAAITVAEFAAQFLRDCAGRWKPITRKHHAQNLRTNLLPVFGARPLVTLRRSDVLAWFNGRSGSQTRALSVLSSLMLHAETLGLRPEGSNPCAGLRRKRTGFVAHYPTAEEYRRVGEVLRQLEPTHPLEVSANRFIALTGARRGEALGLRWAHVESDRAVLPDSKTGPKTIWLPEAVRAVMSRLPRHKHHDFVFGDGNGTLAPSRLWHFWCRVRTAAQVKDIRVHDLRHGYASVGASTGHDLRTLAGLLGHADFATTLGYAHLADGPVASAARRVSQRLARALRPPEPVTPLPAVQALRQRAEQSAISQEREWMRQAAQYWRKPGDLEGFCERQGLDPAAFHQALRRYHRRRRAQHLQGQIPTAQAAP